MELLVTILTILQKHPRYTSTIHSYTPAQRYCYCYSIYSRSYTPTPTPILPHSYAYIPVKPVMKQW